MKTRYSNAASWLWVALPFFLASLALAIYDLVEDGVAVSDYIGEIDKSNQRSSYYDQYKTPDVATYTYVQSGATVTHTRNYLTDNITTSGTVTTTTFAATETYTFTNGEPVDGWGRLSRDFSKAEYTPALTTTTYSTCRYTSCYTGTTRIPSPIFHDDNRRRAPQPTAQPQPPQPVMQMQRRDVDGWPMVAELHRRARIVTAMLSVKLVWHVALLILLAVTLIVIPDHEKKVSAAEAAAAPQSSGAAIGADDITVTNEQPSGEDPATISAMHDRTHTLKSLMTAFVVVTILFVIFGIAAFAVFGTYMTFYEVPDFFIADIALWGLSVIMLIVTMIALRGDIKSSKREAEGLSGGVANTVEEK